MFKTTNGGANWAAANTGLANLGVLSLAIDPATPSTVYAGTGGGVFKTTNGGASWAAANTGLTTNPIVFSLEVNSLAIDPATPSTVYAGTVGGVFKTTNGGANWAAANTGLPNPFVNSLTIDPATPSTVYASTGPFGVFKTTNGGANWAAANTGLTNLNVGPLVIDPVVPAVVYVGTSGGGVFKCVLAITSVSDATPAPGQIITISGVGFSQGPVQVTFGGLPATNVTIVNDTTLVVVVPTIQGPAVLTITTPNGSVTTNVTIIAPTPIPTLSEWGILLLITALAVGGIYFLRRKTRGTNGSVDEIDDYSCL